MNWDVVKESMLDELDKIAEVDLRGLSADTVMAGAQPPPPFETSGLEKARQILAKVPQAEAEMANAGAEKTADVKEKLINAGKDTLLSAGFGGAAGALIAKKGQRKKGALRGALAGGGIALGAHGLKEGLPHLTKLLNRKFDRSTAGSVVDIAAARKHHLSHKAAKIVQRVDRSLNPEHDLNVTHALPVLAPMGGYFAGATTHLKKKKEDKEKKADAASKYEYGRDLALKMLAGAGAGAGLANLKSGASTKNKVTGAAIGASLFGLDHVISKRIAKNREDQKKHEEAAKTNQAENYVKAKAQGLDQSLPSKLAFSPAEQLAVSRKIGVPTGKRVDGVSSLSKYTPKI